MYFQTNKRSISCASQCLIKKPLIPFEYGVVEFWFNYKEYSPPQCDYSRFDEESSEEEENNLCSQLEDLTLDDSDDET